MATEKLYEAKPSAIQTVVSANFSKIALWSMQLLINRHNLCTFTKPKRSLLYNLKVDPCNFK